MFLLSLKHAFLLSTEHVFLLSIKPIYFKRCSTFFRKYYWKLAIRVYIIFFLVLPFYFVYDNFFLPSKLKSHANIGSIHIENMDCFFNAVINYFKLSIISVGHVLIFYCRFVSFTFRYKRKFLFRFVFDNDYLKRRLLFLFQTKTTKRIFFHRFQRSKKKRW